jgi:hypothetical protein
MIHAALTNACDLLDGAQIMSSLSFLDRVILRRVGVA